MVCALAFPTLLLAAVIISPVPIVVAIGVNAKLLFLGMIVLLPISLVASSLFAWWMWRKINKP